jgi:hypothetical protein
MTCSPATMASRPSFRSAERLEIVRSVRWVDAAVPAMTNDKVEIWKDLRFNMLFKGNDWQGADKGDKLEREFEALGVEVVYFPYTLSTSSSALRRTLQNTELLFTQLCDCRGCRAGVRGLIAPEREELRMNNIREGMSPPETSVGALGISTSRQGAEGPRAGGSQSRMSRSCARWSAPG